jgi:exonuclease SbcC
MIPLKLTIEGLYSYQKRQTIDFKVLTESHLFGIFGTVGSGKSTILEAITFALYGKTDRLNLSGDNRNYNMMNLKSNKLFIEFDFKAGKDEIEYRVIVQAKRNSKKYDDVKKPDRTVYTRKNNDLIPTTSEELERVIGLSYDNFKRTVIIPQGKFQEFLQLGNTERTRMLKELFNLNKYEMSLQVKSLEEKNNARIQTINGRLEQLGGNSESLLKELETKLKEILLYIASLSKQQKEMQVQLQEQEQLKQFVIKLKEKKEHKTKLAAQKEDIEQLEQNVKAYEYCLIEFKTITDTLLHHEEKVKQLQQQILLNEKQINIHRETFEAVSKEFKKTQEQYDNLDAIKKEVEYIGKYIQVEENKQLLQKNATRLTNGQKAIEEVTLQMQALELNDEKITTKLHQLKKQLPNIQDLTKAQQWHHEQKTLTKNLKDNQTEQIHFKNQLKDSNEALNTNTKDYATYLAHSNKENWIEIIEELKLKQEAELKIITNKINELLIHSGLDNYAKKLKPDEPCPLCGSKQHPSPLNNKDLSLQIEQKKEDEKMIYSTIKKLEQTSNIIHRYFAETKPLNAQIEILTKKETELIKLINQHQTYIIDTYKDARLVEETIAKTNKTEEKIKEVEQQASENKNLITIATKKKERYQNELQYIKTELNQYQHTIKLLSEQIPQDISEKYRHTDNLTEQKDILQKKAIDTTNSYLQIQKQIDEASIKLNQYKGSLHAQQRFFKNEQTELEKVRKQLIAKIEASPYNDLNEISGILNQNIQVAESKNRIKDYHQQIYLIDKQINELTLQIGNKTYNAEQHQLLIQKIEDTQVSLTQSTRISGEIDSKLKDERKKLELKEELQKNLTELTIRAENILTLKRLFHKSGFVNYISSVFLQNLCLTANERFFKMTRQKLSLELNTDNNFEVRDFMNGGKLRSVKTLSGGQTFQAALSLALALSDNIQSQTETKQNFFFLDEGFGSLDKESLDIVFSTLKNLRKENRIVGLISHVEEMQQEIPTFLSIIQDEESGSWIKESWNE